MVAPHPGRLPFGAPVVVRLEGDQRQRHHFERREHRAQRQHRFRRAGEIEVMEGAQHAAAQEDHGREHDIDRRRRGPQQPHMHEHPRHPGGGEHLEDAFHPQMHHPPAPVFGDGEMAVAPVEEAGAEQQADAGRRQQQQQQQVPVGARPADGRQQAAHHQGQPDQQAGEDQHLPETAHVEELVALMAEPVDQVGIPQAPRQGEPLARQRSQNGHHQRHPQRVHAQPLPGRLEAGDHGRQIESGAQPGGGDPQHGELHVPGAGERIGGDVGERNAVEVVAFHGVMGGDRPQRDLQGHQGGDDPDVFHHRPHGVGGRRDRILRRIAGLGLAVALPLVALAQEEPAQRAGAGDQQHDRDERPDEGGARRPVADQRLVRPVAGVGDVVAGAQGDGRPGRPPPPRHQGADVLVGIGAQGVVGDGEGLAQGFGLGVVAAAAEERRVVADQGPDGAGPLRRDDDAPALLVIGVDAQLGRQRRDARRPLRFLQGVDVPLQIQHTKRFFMENIGRPVGSKITPMPPDRAQLHAAQAPPHVAPGVNVVAGEQHRRRLAVDDHDLVRQGRGHLEGAPADRQQDGEHRHQQHGEHRPQPGKGEGFAVVHGLLHRCAGHRRRAVHGRGRLGPARFPFKGRDVAAAVRRAGGYRPVPYPRGSGSRCPGSLR